MAVDATLAGRVFAPSPVYEVGREKVREFARAIGADDPAHHDLEAARALGYRDLVAPPTFAVVIAQPCEGQVVLDPATGLDFSRLVHGEERFRHHRPIVAGDRLVPTLHVDSLREAAGHVMLTTRVEIADETGEPVSTVISMVVIRGEE